MKRPQASGHPERKPDKGKQSDDAVFLDFVLVSFGRLADALEELLHTLHYQQMSPAQHEQRVHDENENSLDDHADRDNRRVFQKHRISIGHGGGPTEHYSHGRHADEDLKLIRRYKQFDSQPENIRKRQSNPEEQNATL
jgi:hypothetical protein